MTARGGLKVAIPRDHPEWRQVERSGGKWLANICCRQHPGNYMGGVFSTDGVLGIYTETFEQAPGQLKLKAGKANAIPRLRPLVAGTDFLDLDCPGHLTLMVPPGYIIEQLQAGRLARGILRIVIDPDEIRRWRARMR